MEKRKRSAKCYWCGQAIKFNPAVRSPNDKLIPINPDDSKHDCPKSPFNKKRPPE
jgi:hypothetical protein